MRNEILEEVRNYLYERLDQLDDDELYDIFSVIIDDMKNDLRDNKTDIDKLNQICYNNYR